MIVGIGVDIVEVERIEQALQRRPERFLQRVYTQAEVADCWPGEQQRYRRLAARFAAKEAALKALGTGLRYGKWTEVEVVRDGLGKPSLRLSGAIGELAAAQGITQFHLSLSHCKEYAMAQVVAER